MSRLNDGAKKLGVTLDEAAIEKFDCFKAELVKFNEVMNLTAVPEDEIETRHFLDSLTPLATGKISPGASVIDVGTGAGFPGLPLAIARQDITVTLLDSLKKRTEFLFHVTKAAGVQNTEIICARAEDAARGEHREKYDVAVSRAVAKLSVLCEYCLPFVKVGGYFLALKGQGAHEELAAAEKAIAELGGETEDIFDADILGDDNRQVIIAIKKVGQTPTKYPRRAGKPTKNPIE